MKLDIYVDFKNEKVYTYDSLYQEAKERAVEFDELHGDEFEDFLCTEEGYSIYDIFTFDIERQEEILNDYHNYNIDIALKDLENDITKFEIDV